MQETIAIVGDGRLGRALASALRAPAPHGRGYAGAGADVVLLCVPDAQIAAAAAAIEPGPLVGHCSGATGLDVLAPHEAFGLHPLMTVTRAGGAFAGAGCAVAGTTPRALDFAARLGRRPGHAALRDRRRGSRRLPRRRVDGLELPGHARVGGRAAGGDRGRRARRCSSRWCAPRSRPGPSRATRRSPGRSSAATRPRWRAIARPSASARPSCSRSTTSLADATRAVAAA